MEKYYANITPLYSGNYQEFYEDGTVRLGMNLDRGLANGISTLYFMNRKVKEKRSYLQGNFHGTWETFHEDGIRIGVANYKNSLKDGNWFIWDKNGTLRYEVEYSKGKKTGLWKEFDETGKLLKEKFFP